MNKKATLGMIFIPLIIIMGAIVWYVQYGLPDLKAKDISQGKVCGDFTSFDSEYICCKDCEKLDLEYFKYEFSSSLFGANVKNCYCESNNEVEQIW